MKAIRGGELSQASNEAQVQLPPGILRAVSGAASHDSVLLTWDDPGDDSITGYRILRRDQDNNPDGDFATIAQDTRLVATSYTDTTVEAERSYAYRVHAISAHGTSPPSPDVQVRTLAAPTDEQSAEPATAEPESVSEGDTDLPNDNTTPGRVVVGGSATGVIGTAGDQDRFAVELEVGRAYRFDLTGSPGGGGTLPDTFFRAIYDSAGQYQADSYNDDFEGGRDSRVTFTATESGTYYARVSGDRDEVGSYTLRVSDVSPEPGAEPTAEPSAELPARPTGLSVVATHRTVSLSWDDPEDAGITGYVILRRNRDADGDGEFTTLVSDTGSAATGYTDDTVEPATRYGYRVRAVNGVGVSEESDVARVRTLAAAIVVRAPEGGGPLWSAELTPGVATDDGDRLLGYSVWISTGELSETTFDAGGLRRVTVQVVMLRGSGEEQELYLGITERLEGEVLLRVGTEEFRLAEAELFLGGNWMYRWSGVGLAWTEGAVVGVSIRVVEPDGASLKGLRLEGMEELPFSAERTRYETGRESGQETATVRAEAEEGGSVSVRTVRSAGALGLDGADADGGQEGHQARLSARGQTLILVTVRSEERDRERVYVVKVREGAVGNSGARSTGARSTARSEESTDATLRGLSVEGADLAPEFASGTYEYQASVGAEVESVIVAATATRSGAETLISPADADPDTAGHQVSLAGAEAGQAPTVTAIVVVVRSADGNALESYVIRVKRAVPPSSDASLAELELEGLELSPVFDGEVYEYTAAAAADVAETTVTATANDRHADVETVPGNEGYPEVDITPGDADPTIPGHQVELGEGETAISVMVTARDGITTRTYTVTVTRAGPPSGDASLAELSLSGLELSPVFNGDTQSYTASAGAAVAQATLVARPTDPQASVVISPADASASAAGWQIALAAAEVGDDPAVTNIVIAVTSSDGTVRQTYLVQVSREAPMPSQTGGFVKVDAGWFDACAIRVDGTAECWRPTGILSGNSGARRKVGTPEGSFTDVVAANLYACGVRADGTGFCWGDAIRGDRSHVPQATSVHGHSHFGVCMGLADGGASCVEGTAWHIRMDPPQSVLDAGPLRSVVAGLGFGCGLDPDGLARCWRFAGDLDAPSDPLKFIAAGGRHACGIKESDSSLMCWKWTYDASSGFGRRPLNSYSHLTTEPDGEFKFVDTSYGPSCAVRVGGDVICWGRGSILSQAVINRRFNDVPEGEYLTVSIDWDSFACGLRTDRSIACWGWDNEVLADSIPSFESPWKDNADLLGLELSGAELSPSFDREVTGYSASVASDVTTLTVTPSLTNTLATYTVTSDGDADVTGNEVDLVVGDNTITVTVTSADATTAQTYTIVVTR